MPLSLFFFFNDTATTEIYTLSLHDALPIFARRLLEGTYPRLCRRRPVRQRATSQREPDPHAVRGSGILFPGPRVAGQRDRELAAALREGGLARLPALGGDHARAAERRRHPVLRGPGRRPCSAAAARVAALRRPVPDPDPHGRWIYGFRNASRHSPAVVPELGRRSSCTWLPDAIYVEQMSAASNRRGAGVIPCLNEEITLGRGLDGFCTSLPPADLYVIDNNPSDRTPPVAAGHRAGVHPGTRAGKGFAVRKA